MATPIILYRNIFRTAGAVITSSGADTGFSAADVADHRAWKGWQGNVLTSPQWIQVDTGAGGANADSILIINGNLVSNGGQVTIKADGSNPPTTTRQAAYSPTSDVADYKAFTAPGAQRYWRIEFSDPSAPFSTKPFVGEVLLGMKLDVGEYVAPDIDPFMHDIIGKSTRSEGPPQHWLGTVLQGIDRSGVLKFGGDVGVDRAKFTSDLTDFLQNHYRKFLPFGLVLDSADSDFTPARWMMRPQGAKVPVMPAANTYARFRFDLACEPALVEAA